VLVARDHDGKRDGVAMRWDLIPSWAKNTKMAQIGNLITDARNRWLVEVVDQQYQSQ
jgi:putative SOS response-associated peptidase YedK